MALHERLCVRSTRIGEVQRPKIRRIIVNCVEPDPKILNGNQLLIACQNEEKNI